MARDDLSILNRLNLRRRDIDENIAALGRRSELLDAGQIGAELPQDRAGRNVESIKSFAIYHASST